LPYHVFWDQIPQSVSQQLDRLVIRCIDEILAEIDKAIKSAPWQEKNQLTLWRIEFIKAKQPASIQWRTLWVKSLSLLFGLAKIKAEEEGWVHQHFLNNIHQILRHCSGEIDRILKPYSTQ